MSYLKDRIKAEWSPDLDDWGVDDYWDLEDWIQWHKKLVEKYKDQTITKKDKKTPLNKSGIYYLNPKADAIWLEAWKRQTYGAKPTNELSEGIFNEEKISYFFDKPLLFIGTGQFVQLGVNPTYQAIAGREIIEDAAKGLYDFYKIIKYTIIGLVGLAVIGISFYAYNTIKGKDIDINLGGIKK